MSLSALDILRRGRERIARDGWVQCGPVGTGIGWSTFGAAFGPAFSWRYDGPDDEMAAAYDALCDAICDVDDVLAAYDWAIGALEAQR